MSFEYENPSDPGPKGIQGPYFHSELLSLAEAHREKFPILCSIDRYDDTSFRGDQLPGLLEELRRAIPLFKGNKEIVAYLDRLILRVEKAIEIPGGEIKYEGE